MPQKVFVDKKDIYMPSTCGYRQELSDRRRQARLDELLREKRIRALMAANPMCVPSPEVADQTTDVLGESVGRVAKVVMGGRKGEVVMVIGTVCKMEMLMGSEKKGWVVEMKEGLGVMGWLQLTGQWY